MDSDTWPNIKLKKKNIIYKSNKTFLFLNKKKIKTVPISMPIRYVIW